MDYVEEYYLDDEEVLSDVIARAFTISKELIKVLNKEEKDEVTPKKKKTTTKKSTTKKTTTKKAEDK